MPATVAIRDVIKPNPYDGALAAPVLSNTWWNRMAAGQERAFQRNDPGAADGAGGAAAPPKTD
jgi:hypothetical protein